MREKLPLRPTLLLSFGAFTIFSALALPLGILCDLIVWSPTWSKMGQVSVTALIIPSLTEEIVFRGPLLLWPRRWVLLLSSILFTLWHPLEAARFLPQASAYFYDPIFLIIVAGFGFLAGGLVLITRRLLPAILSHWVMVVAWKQLFSGPTLVGGAL